MKRILVTSMGLAVLALAGCNGVNPLNPTTTTPGSTPDAVLELPPGTTSPTASSSIARYEARDGEGSGYAESITYNVGSDTFTVDNLAFDGATPYSADAGAPALGTTGTVNAYENAATVLDPVNGLPINQFPHKAILGRSTNVDGSGDPRTTFAIVRTGAYIGYGFGGFVYSRNGGVTIPTSGQATFSGDYAGLRDFQGLGGLEYVTGDMTINIDFDDFNDGEGVNGAVTNRRYYDTSGTDVTATYLTALNLASLPVLTFTVGPGVMNADGELAGDASSTYVDTTGSEPVLMTYEAGKYYAIMSGAAAEIVGVMVVEGEHPIIQGLGFRETGGFIVYR